MPNLEREMISLHTAQVERQGGDFVVRIPEQFVADGEIDAGDSYRVGLYPSPKESRPRHPPIKSVERSSSSIRDGGRGRRTQHREDTEPPVEEGDVMEVEIENIGEQGDGIAKTEEGFAVIVPGSAVGDELEVKVTKVKPNFAFADIVEELTPV